MHFLLLSLVIISIVVLVPSGSNQGQVPIALCTAQKYSDSKCPRELVYIQKTKAERKELLLSPLYS